MGNTFGKRKVTGAVAEQSPRPSKRARTDHFSAKKYEVFISHRGPDVKHFVACHISDLLEARGIQAFFDIKEMEAGKTVTQQIQEAIESSKVQIVIFSQRFAESKWCLDELTMMIEKHRDGTSIVIPIFYDVQPHEVRFLKGNFGQNFMNKHQVRHTAQKIEEWKKVLQETSEIPGFCFPQLEGALVKKVVTEVCNYLQIDILHVPDNVVLSLKGCSSLEDIPETFGQLEKQRELDLGNCDHLRSLPESFGWLKMQGCQRVSGSNGRLSDSSSDEEEESENEAGNDEAEKLLVTKTPTGQLIYQASFRARFTVPIRCWSRGKVLGKGSFGTVFEAISDTGSFFAVKEVSLTDQGSDAKQCVSQLEQEIALLSKFQHENIVQYIGTDKEPDKLYIFLELVPQGSLAKLYQDYSLEDSHVREYTRQILIGLEYLHDRCVVHRDIKCANILVDSHGSIKLADFGLAKQVSNLVGLKSCKGSAYWMAPEVIHPRKEAWTPADIWSLGCTVLEMLCRKPPRSDLELPAVIYKSGNGEPPPIPNSLSKDAKDFIHHCLKVDPHERPSAANLLNHPFVRRSSSEQLPT